MAKPRKIQIWLRPDQIDLIDAMLQACHDEFTNTVGKFDFHAKKFCQRRIIEIRQILPASDKGASVTALPTRAIA